MKPYTVVLLRPESITDGELSTYTTFVHAEDENDAAAKAAREAAAVDGYLCDDEYTIIGLFKGVHENMA